MREFDLLGANDDKPNPLLLERLRACCQVINALGYKVKRPGGEKRGVEQQGWEELAALGASAVRSSAPRWLQGGTASQQACTCLFQRAMSRPDSWSTPLFRALGIGHQS